MAKTFSRLPDFDPPLVGKDPEYVIFQGEMHVLPAKSLVKQLRAAGLSVFMEKEPATRNLAQPGGVSLYVVYVVRTQYLCALLAWRLGRKGVSVWHNMGRKERADLAIRAMADGALTGGESWDLERFNKEGLSWLRWQLNMDANRFSRFLERARQNFERIARRDLVWGAWIGGSPFLMGAFWGWMTDFASWEPWVVLLFGVVVGGYTLVYSLPRAIRIKYSREDSDLILTKNDFFPPPETKSSGKPTSPAPKSAAEAITELKKKTTKRPPSPSHAIGQAKEYLNRGDAPAALKVLEGYAATYPNGPQASDPAFLRLLEVTRKSLGGTPDTFSDGKPNWVTDLEKGHALLQSGKARESLICFRRSLQANPGEAGTIAGEKAAQKGIQRAEALLRQRTSRNA